MEGADICYYSEDIVLLNLFIPVKFDRLIQYFNTYLFAPEVSLRSLLRFSVLIVAWKAIFKLGKR
jgi:hypothetical protein